MALPEARMQLAEYKRNAFVVVVDETVSMEMLLEPEFWAHVSSKMKAFDRVEVQSEEGLFWAELLVVRAGSTWAKMMVLKHVPLEASPVKEEDELPEGLEVKFRGPQLRWSVIRSADKKVIKEQIPTKGEAYAAAREYHKLVAA